MKADRVGMTVLALLFYMLCRAAVAFLPPEDSVGPLRAWIEAPTQVSPGDLPFQGAVCVRNESNGTVSVSLTMAGTDGWSIAPNGETVADVEAGKEARFAFSVSAPDEVFNAHYPVHAWIECHRGNETMRLHPILVFETTRFPVRVSQRKTVSWKPIEIGKNTAVPLQALRVFRVLIEEKSNVKDVMPAGWQGNHEVSRADVRLDSYGYRGSERPAIAMHPAWYGGRSGAVILEFPVLLPDQTPLSLSFANAIRDHFPEHGEPASDGVTFRVRVCPFESDEATLGDIIFERHSLSKVWEEGSVDLSPYAGQAVRLQLEAHPGPANDTTCDGCFWAEPILLAGKPSEEKEQLGKSFTLGTIASLGEEYSVTLLPGAMGMIDGVIRFQNNSAVLEIHGFLIKVAGHALRFPDGVCRLIDIINESSENVCRIRHQFQTDDGEIEIMILAQIIDGAVKMTFSLEKAPTPQPWFAPRIEHLSLGPWSDSPSRVYAGVGNVVVEPQHLALYFDGHQLATSFAGFEFPCGISVVQAVDVPPSMLRAVRERNICTLETSLNQSMYLIPSPSVWEGVFRWRELDKRQAAGGVERLAGRFVFDLWGGHYAPSTELLRRAFQYGLTDSVVVWHAWQRWGYDYRLPDIFPPNPHLGTLEEFQNLAELCKNEGVLFAVHDNYIDFYPDADGFSYDHVAFNDDGTPQRGWFNAGPKAQAYRFRPDRFQPFTKRNLELIKTHIAPTAYFIDVWSSMGPHDFWTRTGEFYGRTFTQKAWGETFAYIRDALNGAPQISESGHDQLIGWLDGAQTNHLRWGRVASGTHGTTVWDFPATDGERIPWIDAAYHDRFILHGAGYEQRYCSGLDMRLHGMYSDDYMCTEVLTGHPPVVDSPFGRGVVRKYWLLHDAMRGLERQRIQNVEFYEGDIHRQCIAWTNGTVWVNRGQDDWQVEGHVLPQYGFWARVQTDSGITETTIYRAENRIVEKTLSPTALYVNARPASAEREPVDVRLEDISFVSPNIIRLKLQWTIRKLLESGLQVFVHFVDDNQKIVFQGDFMPTPSAEAWSGEITTTREIVIPETVPVGTRLELRVGLYKPQGGARVPVGGPNDGRLGVRLASVQINGTANQIENLTWQTIEEAETESLTERYSACTNPVDFEEVVTDGGCRIVSQLDGIYVIPLPESPIFQVAIRWDRLPWDKPVPKRITALDMDGNTLRECETTWQDDMLRLTCEPHVFAYRLN